MKDINKGNVWIITFSIKKFFEILKIDGEIAEEYSYDTWGRRRNPHNWTYTDVPTPTLLTSGYTGHEHLDKFGLINMNGRIYDPVLGRMLSPDNYIGSAD